MYLSISHMDNSITLKKSNLSESLICVEVPIEFTQFFLLASAQLTYFHQTVFGADYLSNIFTDER